jgi:hypothetical protein
MALHQVEPDVLMLLPDNDLALDNRVRREAGTLATAGYRVAILARASNRAAMPCVDSRGVYVE